MMTDAVVEIVVAQAEAARRFDPSSSAVQKAG